jgi:D-threonine aldolase
LDVDVGMHRTGIAAGKAAVAVYRLLATLPGLMPGGLHCYDGHNHAPSLEARTAIAAGCHETALSLKRTLNGLGLEVPLIVMGGSPGFPCYAPFSEVELSAGTCYLQDWGNQRAFPDLAFQPAAVVMSRVVSRPGPGRVTIDCGSKGIASDPPGERGLPLNLRDARTILHSEEHWVIESPDADNLPIGSEVYIVPTHICPTFALYAAVRVVESSGIIRESWPVTARDRSIGI